MTRGDTLKVTIDLTQDGEPYIPVEGDVIRFAVKKGEFVDVEPRILREVPIDTMTLVLDPEDTKDMEFGTYVYDMEITFADGTVDTFITESKFRLKPEVH